MAAPAPKLWPMIAMLLRGDSRERLTSVSLAPSTTRLALSSIPAWTLPLRNGSFALTTSPRASAAEAGPWMQSTISPVSGSEATKKPGSVLDVETCTCLMSSACMPPMRLAMDCLSPNWAAAANLAYRAALFNACRSAKFEPEVRGFSYRCSCSACLRTMPKFTMKGWVILLPPAMLLSISTKSSESFLKAPVVSCPKVSSKCCCALVEVSASCTQHAAPIR
mmetsp:Transcript_11526/g.24194  ORF Transcript_11526/g.24194 Transcript_11526/m.24194 type:complete len:222 (-) Transcript_11526:65-730(-)